MKRNSPRKKAQKPNPIEVADRLARAALEALLSRLPRKPEEAVTAAVVLRLPGGIVAVPVGRLPDVLQVLSEGRELIAADGMGRVTYRLGKEG